MCGKLSAYEDAPEIFAAEDPERRERAVSMIKGFYADRPEMQRDEAIRGASLAAMSFMLAAKSRGYDTGPMIGFDPGKVSELLHIGPEYIPVMMVVLGKRNQEPGPRGHRFAVSEVVKLDHLDGPGLA